MLREQEILQQLAAMKDRITLLERRVRKLSYALITQTRFQAIGGFFGPSPGYLTGWTYTALEYYDGYAYDAFKTVMTDPVGCNMVSPLSRYLEVLDVPQLPSEHIVMMD